MIGEKGQTYEKYNRSRKNRLTDGVHGVRRELKDTIKNKVTALEEDVAPVPPVVLYYVVCFGLHPQVECDQCYATDPPIVGEVKCQRRT